MGLEQRSEHVVAEVFAGADVLSGHEQIAARGGTFFFSEGKAREHAIAHLGEVTVVVLRLDEQRAQRACRDNAEELAPDGPAECGLQAEGALADARRSHDQHAAATAEVTVPEQFVGVVGGRCLQHADGTVGGGNLGFASSCKAAPWRACDGGGCTSGMSALSAHAVLLMAGCAG